MSAMTRAEQIAAQADETVCGWQRLTGEERIGVARAVAASRTATVRPIRGGGVEVSYAGVDRTYPSLWAAIDELDAMGVTPIVGRFPQPSIEVLAESPALRA